MKAVDIFSGCGGLSLGLQQSGIEVVAGIDDWDKSLDVYRSNFKHDSVELDLSNVKLALEKLDNYKFELIAGGPPCQDFSSAGKRDASAGRADLTYRFSEIVQGNRPKFFIMENVQQIRKSSILLDIIKDLAGIGYGMTACILDASLCGVPQARQRFFLVGALNQPHNFLLEVLKTDLAPKPMTVRDYFGEELAINFYYRHPRNYNRRAVYSIDEPSATIRGVNRPVPPGYKMHPNDPEGINLKEIRPLTTDERARVQTFPNNFIWLGSKTDREQMIGNAVPVALAKYVGHALQKFIKGIDLPQSEFLDVSDPSEIFLPLRPLNVSDNEFTYFQAPIGVNLDGESKTA
jgi:DNA (cytosine-5)-methyltransferase 1